MSIANTISCLSPWGQTGAIPSRLALFARRSIPRSRRAALRRSRVARPRAVGRTGRRPNRPRLLQRHRLQQHPLLGLEPVDHVAARRGMGRIWSARAHARPDGRSIFTGDDTRCAAACDTAAALTSPSVNLSSFCALVQSAAQGAHPVIGIAVVQHAGSAKPRAHARRRLFEGWRLSDIRRSTPMHRELTIAMLTFRELDPSDHGRRHWVVCKKRGLGS
jgi:hypothetical protein